MLSVWHGRKFKNHCWEQGHTFALCFSSMLYLYIWPAKPLFAFLSWRIYVKPRENLNKAHQEGKTRDFIQGVMYNVWMMAMAAAGRLSGSNLRSTVPKFKSYIGESSAQNEKFGWRIIIVFLRISSDPKIYILEILQQDRNSKLWDQAGANLRGLLLRIVLLVTTQTLQELGPFIQSINCWRFHLLLPFEWVSTYVISYVLLATEPRLKNLCLRCIFIFVFGKARTDSKNVKSNGLVTFLIVALSYPWGPS